LVELLVVIAIIAILAALAFPVVGGMLDRGADAQDMGNLRQIGTAMGQFAAENNNRWPNAKLPIPGTSGDPIFMEHVDRMLPPDALFQRNSRFNYNRRPMWYSKRFAKMPKGAAPATAANQYYWGLAWGLNQHLWGSANPAHTTVFNGYINQVPNLSKLVIVGEKNRNGGNDFRPDDNPVFTRDSETSYRISRPGNRAYYLFGDYHIKALEGDQSTKKYPEYRSYNPTNALYYRWW
jgi:hypothetical protein